MIIRRPLTRQRRLPNKNNKLGRMMTRSLHLKPGTTPKKGLSAEGPVNENID